MTGNLSLIVPAARSFPRASASYTMASAVRSSIDPAGFERSDLIQTSCAVPNTRLARMCGVLPIVARMSATLT
jgi:hypothetical protein